MHRIEAIEPELEWAVLQYAVDRIHLDPPPLDHPRSPAELAAAAGQTITPGGLGGLEALRVFAEVLAPANLSIDHPRFLSFVPAAPTEASVLFDLVVAASALFGGTWLEASGAVFAENQALRWIADLAGFPPSAGGVFVPGGSAGNLNGLAAARHHWRSEHPAHHATRGLVAACRSAHSSIAGAARLLDVDVLDVPADPRGRLTGDALAAAVEALPAADRDRLFAVVATAGSTNVGVVDDLDGVATVATDAGAWFHCDGAYGGAALAAPTVRSLFRGVERADSFIVDPHKWLFTAYDCCALLYRQPAVARRAFTQQAEYLEVINASEEWNPSDYAFHLTRRARGMPFWFSLATHGTDAYTEAVEATLAVTRAVGELIREAPHLELVLEPELSVVVLRRLGWAKAEYEAWSARALAEGLAFVVPTTWRGETVLRFCFVNPRTTVDEVAAILEDLRRT